MLPPTPIIRPKGVAKAAGLPAIDAAAAPSQNGAQIDLLLNVREGADYLGISVPTFWRWISKGLLPKPIKLGGLSRWLKSDLVAFVAAAKAHRDAS
jgi:excisionase family DNA binding protein